MFDFTSRYYLIDTAVYVSPGGRQISYKRRRFLPQGDELPLLAEATVVQGDRMDLVSARTLGVPETFWRIADANNAMDPADLTSEPGRQLRIPQPQP
jgi:hypothetical protein